MIIAGAAFRCLFLCFQLLLKRLNSNFPQIAAPSCDRIIVAEEPVLSYRAAKLPSLKALAKPTVDTVNFVNNSISEEGVTVTSKTNSTNTNNKALRIQSVARVLLRELTAIHYAQVAVRRLVPFRADGKKIEREVENLREKRRKKLELKARRRRDRAAFRKRRRERIRAKQSKEGSSSSTSTKKDKNFNSSSSNKESKARDSTKTSSDKISKDNSKDKKSKKKSNSKTATKSESKKKKKKNGFVDKMTEQLREMLQQPGDLNLAELGDLGRLGIGGIDFGDDGIPQGNMGVLNLNDIMGGEGGGINLNDIMGGEGGGR